MDLSPISEPSSWNRRTTMEKRLIIALILSVVISMALMFALIFARPIIIIAQTTTTAPQEEVCVTKGCIKAAGQILERIDRSVQPCDNFYKFACGSYIKNTVIPPGKSNVTSLEVIRNKVQEQLREALELPILGNETGTTALIKKYYRACMNTTLIEKSGLELLRNLLSTVGGWPLLNRHWNEEEFEWTQLIYKFREVGLDSDIFIRVVLTVDIRNSSQHMIQLKQPKFGIPPKYLVKGMEDKFVKAYYDYMVNTAVYLGADKQKAGEELKESLEFEMQLANFSLSDAEAREVPELHHAKPIHELEEEYPDVPWLDYLNQILALDAHLKSSEAVLVTIPTYLSQLQRLIADTSKRTQANYALWRNIQQLVTFSPRALKDEETKFKKATDGVEILPRWEECVNEANDRLSILAGYLYVQSYFDRGSKQSVTEIVQYIRQAFKDILEHANWMDLDTQRSALDKAQAVQDHMGYPDELLNEKRIKELYKEAETYTDQYLQSYLNIQRSTLSSYYRELREITNNSNWMSFANTATATAKYYPKSNSIVFSAGILQDLLFSSDRPQYMNFGAIGTMMGHQLIHGFDYSGRTVNKNGMPFDWWAPKTKQLFLKNAECIIHQYENYTVPELGTHLNGKHTKNENIADNGGVKEAYLAYKTWEKSNNAELQLPGLDYSPKQLFWISYAMQWCIVHKLESLTTIVSSDIHSPNEFRVVGPLSNFKQFSEDFDCKLGTKMNPINKCSVW